jgi:hypothetical protein|nr:MAG TPA: hypothetical protein [Caudoviricetes sp.]
MSILFIVLAIIYVICCGIIGKEISGNRKAFIAVVYILLFNAAVVCVLATKW